MVQKVTIFLPTYDRPEMLSKTLAFLQDAPDRFSTGLVRHLQIDSSKAAEKLGWRAKWSLDAAVPETIACIKLL
jgi:nucleoside-diphosphate-sugar epimerase